MVQHVTNANWERILKSVKNESRNAIEGRLADAKERLVRAEKEAREAEHKYQQARTQSARLKSLEKRARTHGGGRSRSGRVHVKSRSRTRKNRRY